MGNRQRLAGFFLAGLVGLTLVVIIYGRLTPFNFVYEGENIGELLGRIFLLPHNIRDLFVNFLLFIPLGFGLSGLLRRAGRTWQQTWWISLTLGLALTITLEIMQLFLPERTTAVADIVANSFGLLAGYGLYRTWDYGIGRTLQEFFIPRNVIVGLIIYGLLLAFFTFWLVGSVDLRDWNPSYPLLLGNETTDKRPWVGIVEKLVLYDRPLDGPEAEALLGGSVPGDALAHYQFSGPAPYLDQQKILPALNWQDSSSKADNEAGAFVGPRGWLTTGKSVAAFSTAVGERSMFTVALNVTPWRASQGGPARLMTISDDVDRRNLTIGQHRRGLSVRIRTPISGENGLKPEIIVPDVFGRRQPVQIIVSYDAPMLTIYIDNAQPRIVSLAPGLAFFQDFSGSNRWLVEIPEQPHHYDTLYWAVMVVPALMLAMVLLVARRLTWPPASEEIPDNRL